MFTIKIEDNGNKTFKVILTHETHGLLVDNIKPGEALELTPVQEQRLREVAGLVEIPEDQA